jgi:hypothetical protein
MLDLLWFVLFVGIILVAGLVIGMLVVWVIGWLARRSGRDEEDGVTPVGPPSPDDGPERASSHAAQPAAQPDALPNAQPDTHEAEDRTAGTAAPEDPDDGR